MEGQNKHFKPFGLHSSFPLLGTNHTVLDGRDMIRQSQLSWLLCHGFTLGLHGQPRSLPSSCGISQHLAETLRVILRGSPLPYDIKIEIPHAAGLMSFGLI